MSKPDYLESNTGDRIAYHHSSGAAPGILFCGGFRSDMTGSKALHLESWCQANAHQFTRFDYMGHGQSSGEFTQGTISRWVQNAQDILDHVTTGPQIIIGSSMGGWIMLRLAQLRAERLHGLIGIAPAPDFTDKMTKEKMTDEDRATLARDGVLYRPSDYGDPYPITAHLLEDGANNLVLEEGMEVAVPVRILQGMADSDVPWLHAIDTANAIRSDDVQIHFLKDGDHRMSSPAQLELLVCTIGQLL